MPYGGTTPEQDEKIERCVLDMIKKDDMMSKYPDSDERKKHAIAMCKSSIMHSGKEFKECQVKGVSVSTDTGDYILKGIVATSHIDDVGDFIPVETLNSFAKQISMGGGHNKVSVHHDRSDPVVAGVMSNPSVSRLPDGEYGLMVDILVDKTKEDFEDTKYRIEKGLIDSLSIEYDTNGGLATREVSHNGKHVRVLEPSTTLFGAGLASRPVNPNAGILSYGFKEFCEYNSKISFKNLKGAGKEQIVEDESKMVESKVEVQQKEKVEDVKAEVKESVKTFTEAEVKEMVKREVQEMMMKDKPLSQKEKKIEMKEYDAYKAALLEVKELDKKSFEHWEARESLRQMSVDAQYKEAARLVDALDSRGMVNGLLTKRQAPSGAVMSKEFKCSGSRVEVKEMEFKTGLQTDTNLSVAAATDLFTGYAGYYQSPVELNDIYQPIIVNQLNDMTTTWGRLTKEDFSRYAAIQFRARTGRNSTAAGYDEAASFTYNSNVGRNKFNQAFCYYHVLVQVTGQEIALSQAPGGIGDIYSDEVKWATADLMRALNLAVIGTGDGTSTSTSLGFEGLILGTTGTLYGRDISVYTTLKSHKEDMSSAHVTLGQLRKMIRNAEGADTTITNSNANRNDLVFFCNPLQRDLIYALIQDMQRTVPMSARVGYEGVLEIDGVPVFADPRMNTDDIFLIDTAHTKIAIKLAATYEETAKTLDARNGHIKIYWNLYSDAPSNNYWAYGFATS